MLFLLFAQNTAHLYEELINIFELYAVGSSSWCSVAILRDLVGCIFLNVFFVCVCVLPEYFSELHFCAEN